MSAAVGFSKMESPEKARFIFEKSALSKKDVTRLTNVEFAGFVCCVLAGGLSHQYAQQAWLLPDNPHYEFEFKSLCIENLLVGADYLFNAPFDVASDIAPGYKEKLGDALGYQVGLFTLEPFRDDYINYVADKETDLTRKANMEELYQYFGNMAGKVIKRVEENPYGFLSNEEVVITSVAGLNTTLILFEKDVKKAIRVMMDARYYAPEYLEKEIDEYLKRQEVLNKS